MGADRSLGARLTPTPHLLARGGHGREADVARIPHTIRSPGSLPGGSSEAECGTRRNCAIGRVQTSIPHGAQEECRPNRRRGWIRGVWGTGIRCRLLRASRQQQLSMAVWSNTSAAFDEAAAPILVEGATHGNSHSPTGRTLERSVWPASPSGQALAQDGTRSCLRAEPLADVDAFCGKIKAARTARPSRLRAGRSRGAVIAAGVWPGVSRAEVSPGRRPTHPLHTAIERGRRSRVPRRGGQRAGVLCASTGGRRPRSTRAGRHMGVWATTARSRSPHAATGSPAETPSRTMRTSSRRWRRGPRCRAGL